jgi:Skp family chaperone for outer membrane proteins
MFNKSFSYGVLIVSLLIANVAKAGDSLEGKMAIVDVQKLMKESLAVANIREQLDKKREVYKNEINKKENALNKQHQELSKQQSVLSKEAFEAKLQKFNEKVAEVQRDVQQKGGSLEQAYVNAIQKVEAVIDDIITNIAQDKGYELVLPQTGVIYNKPALNISDEVLKKLNVRLTKVEVEIDESGAKK